MYDILYTISIVLHSYKVKEKNMVCKRTRIFTEGELDYMKVMGEKGKNTAEGVKKN